MGKGSTEARGKHSIRRNSCRVVSLCPQWSVFHNASSAFSRSISPKWQLIGQLICKWPKCCLLLQSGQMRTSARQISSKLVADHRRMKHCWAQWPSAGRQKCIAHSLALSVETLEHQKPTITTEKKVSTFSPLRLSSTELQPSFKFRLNWQKLWTAYCFEGSSIKSCVKLN